MTAIAIAEAEQLGNVAADHQHRARLAARLALGNERIDELVDLRLARDVDAASRFVEEQDVDVVMEQPGDRDLLLVAARELGNGLTRAAGLDVKPLHPARRGAILCAWEDHRPRPKPLESRERHVVGDGQRRGETFLFAILAEKPAPHAPPLVRCWRPRPRAEAHAPGAHRLETEESAHQPGAPGAEQSGNAENLAAVQRECRARRAECGDVENRRALPAR